MRTVEIKLLRTICGLTLRDSLTNTNIRERCKIDDVVKFMKRRKTEWNEHVKRMTKICKNERPIGRRPLGRPSKRWAYSWFF